ncbi:MAG: TonB-dependent receptor [Pseudomonadales bacterium]|nr:TonB-dependent receptor [Pseudomonadales bacterium]
MGVRYTHLGLTLLAASIAMPAVVSAAERRQIEEVVVTAERKQSSVQDTSISITAFTSEMMDDFGIRNQSDLQNLVPATTIQPYDSAIRGVGRNFRNLGGDPGVATYMNNVYSEDLYTATIGSFWDVERIEILRGPQGTLYGRNAVGGAMNFIYKKPSDEFEFSAKTVLGDFNTRDYYAVVSGTLIEDILTARLAGSSRERDGWIEERSGLGPDLDSSNEQNISLSLEWNITDNMKINLRTNSADVDRVMGGADGGGLIVLRGENFDGDLNRNFTNQSHQLRAVDPATTSFTSPSFLNPAQPVLSFTNPSTGAEILAQRVRPGIDPGGNFPNYGRNAQYSNSDCVFTDYGDIDGDDLCAYTNGLNREEFDQEGTQMEFSWDISDGLTFKYIFGYNDLLYQRITEDDSTASLTDDRQFYVNHEATYSSHEFQVFWDVSDTLTFTSGVFFYDATIDQRYDFFSSVGGNQVTNPAFALDGLGGQSGNVLDGLNAFVGLPAGTIAGIPAGTPLGAIVGATQIDVFSAKELARSQNAPVGSFTSALSLWTGEAALGSVKNGPVTLGSDLHSMNQTNRQSFAAYTQGVWDINDKFTFTFGIRYAKDELQGEELLARYIETTGLLSAFGIDLATANIFRGALDPATLQPTGNVPPWLGGVPISFGAFRELEREDSKVTWRLNLDYNITDDTMMYGNVTTGYRGGGFNLAFFSQTPQFDPEELIAFELGYKAQFLDGSLQFNSSIYFYDYESIHTFTEEACPNGSQDVDPADATSACAVTNTTSSVQAAPGAEMRGLEFEVLWLATDALTLGGNFSYTDSEYTEDFFIVDGTDPDRNADIFDDATQVDRVRSIKGNGLQQVPEKKSSVYASYNIPLGNKGEVDLLGSWGYIDDVNFSAFQNARDIAPAYERLDIRATWTSPSEAWVVSGFVNNVANEIGIRQIEPGGGDDGFRRTAQVTEPRLYGLEIAYTLL